MYGTNSSSAFNITDGYDLTDLTLLWEFVANAHVASNVEDPQFFVFENSVAYKYMICIITSLYEPQGWFGIRRISFQKRA